jgi:hypothetical protein
MTDTRTRTDTGTMNDTGTARSGATASALPETATPVEQPVEYRSDGGDQERFSHYVPRDKLMQAMVDGTPVRALCGKLWVPSRDPERFPVCPECKEIHESLPQG